MIHNDPKQFGRRKRPSPAELRSQSGRLAEIGILLAGTIALVSAYIVESVGASIVLFTAGFSAIVLGLLIGIDEDEEL